MPVRQIMDLMGLYGDLNEYTRLQVIGNSLC